METADETVGRRNLLARIATGTLSVIDGKHGAASLELPPDFELLTLLAELEATEAASCLALVEYNVAVRANDFAAVELAEHEIARIAELVDEIIARMAATPAVGLIGVCVKARRICASLVGGGDLLESEEELSESLLRDCIRLGSPQMNSRDQD